MRTKVTLELPTGKKPLDKTALLTRGEDNEEVNDLMKALTDVKKECNRVANEEGFPLRVYDGSPIRPAIGKGKAKGGGSAASRGNCWKNK